MILTFAVIPGISLRSLINVDYDDIIYHIGNIVGLSLICEIGRKNFIVRIGIDGKVSFPVQWRLAYIDSSTVVSHLHFPQIVCDGIRVGEDRLAATV